MTLEESIRQLDRGIQSGTLSFHFEVFKMYSGAKQCREIRERISKLEKNMSLFLAGLRCAHSVISAVTVGLFTADLGTDAGPYPQLDS